MKNALLLVVNVLLSTSLLGQQYTSSNPQFGWDQWTQNNCYKGIYLRVQKAYYSQGAKQWYWNWEIQNRYSSKVAFSWAFYDKTEGKPQYTNSRHKFEPNETRSGGSFGSPEELSYILTDVCFRFKQANGTELNDCSENPERDRKEFYYAECDNGSPRYSAYNGSSQGTPSYSASGGATSSSSANSATASFADLKNRWTELCRKAQSSTTGAVIGAYNRSCGGTVQNWVETPSNRVQLVALIDDLEAAFKYKAADNAQSGSAQNQQNTQGRNTPIQQQSGQANPQSSQINAQNSAPSLNSTAQITDAINALTPVIVTGIANAQRMKEEERGLYNVLRGHENEYPDATRHFNTYLRRKKTARVIGWTGGGLLLAGSVALVAGILPEEPNFNLLYAGTGLAATGTGVLLVSVPFSISARSAFSKAQSYVAVGVNSRGVGLTMAF